MKIIDNIEHSCGENQLKHLDFKRGLELGGMLLGLASSNLENSHLLLQQTNSMFQLDVLHHKLAVYVSL